MSYAASVSASSDVERAFAYNANGIEKFQREDYQGAINDFNNAIRLNPNNADFYNNLGAVSTKLGQYSIAIPIYDKAISLNPENAFVYNNRGDVKYNLGQYLKAILDYDKAISLNSQEPIIYRNRGDAKYHRGQYSEAILDYNEAIRLDPQDSTAYKKRGEAKSSLKRYPEAMVDFHMAALLDPTIGFTIDFKMSKQALFDYLILLPDDEGKPLLQACLDKTTVLGKVMWERKGLFECKLESGTLKKIVDYLNPSPSQVNVTLQGSANLLSFFSFEKPKPSTPSDDTQGLSPLTDHRVHQL